VSRDRNVKVGNYTDLSQFNNYRSSSCIRMSSAIISEEAAI